MASISFNPDLTEYTIGQTVTITVSQVNGFGYLYIESPSFEVTEIYADDFNVDVVYDWTPDELGSWYINAGDDAGAVGTTSKNVTNAPPSNDPPTLSFVGVSDGDVLATGGTVEVTAIANDPDGDSVGVTLNLQGPGVNETQTGVDTAFVSSANLVAGSYTATASGDDGTNDVVVESISFTVEAANVPPGVSISGVANGATVDAGTPLNIVANGQDSDGTVASVRLTVDRNGTVLHDATANATSASHDFTPTEPGNYTATAVATDDEGATGTVSVTFTVVAVAPDVVVELSDDTPTVGQAITITGDATDADGTIVSTRLTVERDGETVVDATEATATILRDYTPDTAVLHTATVTASDDDGQTSTASTTFVPEAISSLSADILPGPEQVASDTEGLKEVLPGVFHVFAAPSASLLADVSAPETADALSLTVLDGTRSVATATLTKDGETWVTSSPFSVPPGTYQVEFEATAADVIVGQLVKPLTVVDKPWPTVCDFFVDPAVGVTDQSLGDLVQFDARVVRAREATMSLTLGLCAPVTAVALELVTPPLDPCCNILEDPPRIEFADSGVDSVGRPVWEATQTWSDVGASEYRLLLTFADDEKPHREEYFLKVETVTGRPTATIVAPTSGVQTFGGTLDVEVEASSFDGSPVVSVELFKAEGDTPTVLKAWREGPFVGEIELDSLGSHLLYAETVDRFGQRGRSASVVVNVVEPQAPTVNGQLTTSTRPPLSGTYDQHSTTRLVVTAFGRTFDTLSDEIRLAGGSWLVELDTDYPVGVYPVQVAQYNRIGGDLFGSGEIEIISATAGTPELRVADLTSRVARPTIRGTAPAGDTPIVTVGEITTQVAFTPPLWTAVPDADIPAGRHGVTATQGDSEAHADLTILPTGEVVNRYTGRAAPSFDGVSVGVEAVGVSALYRLTVNGRVASADGSSDSTSAEIAEALSTQVRDALAGQPFQVSYEADAEAFSITATEAGLPVVVSAGLGVTTTPVEVQQADSEPRPQVVDVDASSVVAPYRLTIAGEETYDIEVDAEPSAFASAIGSLSAVLPGDVSVSGGSGVFRLTWSGKPGVPVSVSATPGVDVRFVSPAVPGRPRLETIALPPVHGGSWIVQVNGVWSQPIPAVAGTESIQEILRQHPLVGSDGVAVTDDGSGYRLAWKPGSGLRVTRVDLSGLEVGASEALQVSRVGRPGGPLYYPDPGNWSLGHPPQTGETVEWTAQRPVVTYGLRQRSELHTEAVGDSFRLLAKLDALPGQVVQVWSDGTLPAGLSAGVDYEVTASEPSRLDLSPLSLRNVETGDVVAITDRGEGEHFVGAQLASLVFDRAVEVGLPQYDAAGTPAVLPTHLSVAFVDSDEDYHLEVGNEGSLPRRVQVDAGQGPLKAAIHSTAQGGQSLPVDIVVSDAEATIDVFDGSVSIGGVDGTAWTIGTLTQRGGTVQAKPGGRIESELLVTDGEFTGTDVETAEGCKLTLNGGL